MRSFTLLATAVIVAVGAGVGVLSAAGSTPEPLASGCAKVGPQLLAQPAVVGEGKLLNLSLTRNAFGASSATASIVQLRDGRYELVASAPIDVSGSLSKDGASPTSAFPAPLPGFVRVPSLSPGDYLLETTATLASVGGAPIANSVMLCVPFEVS